MAKVTSKLQVTLPKSLADQFEIRPGDEIEWIAAGDIIRVIPPRKRLVRTNPMDRLKLFDGAIKRYKAWAATQPAWKKSTERGWKREDLYNRGRAR